MKNGIEAMITDITATTAEAEDYTGEDGLSNGMNNDKKKLYTYKSEDNNLNSQYWDIDCDCNLLNDLTGDYGFQEDRGTLKK